MVVARKQTLVQLSDALVAALDERAARDSRSRSDLIREAVELYLAETAEAEIDRRIVQGYTRLPPDDVWGSAPARRAIAEESW
jgi:metal-responsive CopG/Arc/MetJ family transcriptional regulator